MFVDAILEHGVPNRVRGDRGGENRDVSILMILLRGLNHANFIWGPSVFNTRIEHLWVEVGRQFGRQWRAFFMWLERCHLLDRHNSSHRSISFFWNQLTKTVRSFVMSGIHIRYLEQENFYQTYVLKLLKNQKTWTLYNY